jgi:hypothetical protein
VGDNRARVYEPNAPALAAQFIARDVEDADYCVDYLRGVAGWLGALRPCLRYPLLVLREGGGIIQ